MAGLAEMSLPGGVEITAAGGGFAKSNMKDALPLEARIWLRSTAVSAALSAAVRSSRFVFS